MNNQQTKPKPQPNPSSVYVSNLDHSCSNKKISSDLNQIFSKYGLITSIKVNHNLRFKKLFAFVVFADPKDAQEAVENLNNTYFGDSRIKVQMQKGPRAQNNNKYHFAKECTDPAQRRDKKHRSRSPNKDKDKDNERSHKKRGRSRERKKRYSSSSSSSESSSSSSVRDRKESRSRSRSNSSSSSSSSD